MVASMSTDAWLAWLTSKVGVSEQPPHSNRTPIGEEYGWNGVAWCAETQSLAAEHAFGRRVLWTASVADARAKAQSHENGMVWLGQQATIQVGDLPCFDFKGHDNPADMHISGVVNPATQARFETVGGNEGDRVQRQWRDRRYVMGFIRLPFATVGLGSPPHPIQGDDMPLNNDDLVAIQKVIDAAVGNLATNLHATLQDMSAALDVLKHAAPAGGDHKVSGTLTFS